jgi:hypothetical protein
MSDDERQHYGPWNPGLESRLPDAFLPLSTVFDAANVSSSLSEVRQLSDFCGLPIERLAKFKPERLSVHEVLIRVMADLSVPDGQRYEDLGVNFRRITATILDTHMVPLMPEIRQAFDRLAGRATTVIDQLQTPVTIPPEMPAPPGAARWHWLARWRPPAAGTHRKPSGKDPAERDFAVIREWRTRLHEADDPFEHACRLALVTVADAVLKKQGRLPSNRTLITEIATRLVCNDYGSRMIGRIIEAPFHDAVQREGFRLLPAQPHTIVMNVKGASASGKSTMRPLQKLLAAQLGVNWTDFALISPDIWRKFLLDYASLGPARLYAGMLTAYEIEIIDEKLDRYMSGKNKAGRMSHLLIDRFRFDSFAETSEGEDGGRLLTRFGDEVYMFFMITPPEATVERSWKRGEQVGRYKAVDDLLAHNVEAYSGIPGLFFMWALRNDKKVHFEFLDNSVAEGQRPRTVAFGLNGELNVLDINGLLDIDRFRRINIEARSPQEVYPSTAAGDIAGDIRFLKDCIRRMPAVTFAHHATGQIYARLEHGRLVAWDRSIFEQAERSSRARAAFELVIAPPRAPPSGPSTPLGRLDPGPMRTMGNWGAGTGPTPHQPHHRGTQ